MTSLTATQAAQRSTSDNAVRDSMLVLPAAVQLPLTFLIGKPYTGQRPLRLTPTMHLVSAMFSIVAGMAVTGAGLAGAGLWLALLPLGWAITLHGARNLRMMIFHQCAHRNMWAQRRRDHAVGQIVAAVLVIQHFERYSVEHIADHHALHHMTLRDPTVQAFLISLGLRAGMSRRQMWRIVLGRLFSPIFHAQFLWARIRSYTHSASTQERFFAGLGYTAVAATVTLTHSWSFVLLAWVLPITLFYQVSNTLRLLVKHTFPAAESGTRSGREYFASLTNAILLGDPIPPAHLQGIRRHAAWARWWLRALLVHLPSRYLVVTGDTVCHDFHHRHPMSRDWANYIFARQADIESGHRGWPPYHEVWGLRRAINTVLDSLSQADPDEYHPARLAGTSRRQLFAAFDD